MMRAALIAVASLLLSMCRCFVPPATTMRPRLYYSKTITCWGSSSSSYIKGTSSSKNASDIMDTIKTRYGHDDDWKRTRNYVYQASDRLSRKQVTKVLGFLDESEYCTIIRVLCFIELILTLYYFIHHKFFRHCW